MPAKPRKYPRLPPLYTLSGARKLVARLVKESMRGERSVEDCSKIVAMVRVLGEMLQAEIWEKRLDDLEAGKPMPRVAGVPAPFQKLKRGPDGTFEGSSDTSH